MQTTHTCVYIFIELVRTLFDQVVFYFELFRLFNVFLSYYKRRVIYVLQMLCFLSPEIIFPLNLLPLTIFSIIILGVFSAMRKKT